jgi:hypothetical protein
LILALAETWDHHRLQGQQDAEQGRRSGNVQACSVWAVSNQMEAAMYKSLATITGTLAILSAALLTCGSAEAGASASAPSKYSNANQVATVHQARTNRQPHFAITEYSSSSARNPSQKH